MSEFNPGVISSVLLASDLSCRCDRATERARRLARSHGARLTVAIAVEGDPRTPSWRSEATALTSRAQAELADCFHEDAIDWDVRVAEGEPLDVVQASAAACRADVIVTGVARNELLGRASLGRTLESLLRQSPAPVLIVKRRPRGDYRKVFVPIDFSPAAERAVVATARLMPGAEIALLHAYRVPFSGFVSEETGCPEARALAEAEMGPFVERIEAQLGRKPGLTALVEFGQPEALVADYVHSLAPDLMVLGAHDRSGPLGALLHKSADRLALAADCDVLVVPESGR